MISTDTCNHNKFHMEKAHRIKDSPNFYEEGDVFYKICDECGSIEEIIPTTTKSKTPEFNPLIDLFIYIPLMFIYAAVAMAFSLPYVSETVIASLGILFLETIVRHHLWNKKLWPKK